jgi:predicted secreted Zn-dependent protease
VAVFLCLPACALLAAQRQSRQAAAAGYETVDEDAVYAVTGNPRPREVEEAVGLLLKDSFEAGYARE